MGSKYFPSFLMLASGSIVCILSVMNKFSVFKMLVLLLITMFVFYELGRAMLKVMETAKAEQEERSQLEEADNMLKQEQEENEEDILEGTEDESADSVEE